MLIPTHLIAGLSLLVLSTTVLAFSFEDMERLEQVEQGELLEKARQAASAWNFSRARSYLEQARNKGYNPDEVAAVEEQIAKSRAAQAEQHRREQERRLAEQREREEQERLANQAAAASHGGGGSGASVDYVSVQFTDTCGIMGCITSNLQMSGGPGRFEPSYSGASTGAIYKGYGGALAGTYRWSGTLDNRHVCSGTVNVSGRKRSLTISAYSKCSGAYANEH